jgi:hypothetical protein
MYNSQTVILYDRLKLFMKIGLLSSGVIYVYVLCVCVCENIVTFVCA